MIKGTLIKILRENIEPKDSAVIKPYGYNEHGYHIELANEMIGIIMGDASYKTTWVYINGCPVEVYNDWIHEC